MVTLEIISNGNLKITLIEKDAFLEEFPSLYPSVGDLLEAARYLGNNWFDLTDLVGLTGSPIIGFDVSFEENTDKLLLDNAKVWWFPNYQVENPFETLVNEGEVIFTKSADMEKEILYYVVEKELDSSDSLTGNKNITVYKIENNKPIEFAYIEVLNEENTLNAIKSHIDDIMNLDSDYYTLTIL